MSWYVYPTKAVRSGGGKRTDDDQNAAVMMVSETRLFISSTRNLTLGEGVLIPVFRHVAEETPSWLACRETERRPGGGETLRKPDSCETRIWSVFTYSYASGIEPRKSLREWLKKDFPQKTCCAILTLVAPPFRWMEPGWHWETPSVSCM